jgi:geranylgeranyl diphosphate synthase type I
MAGDRERRHRPTAWALFGVGPAICAGDALVRLALRVLLEDPAENRVEALATLCDAAHEVIAGQLLDLSFEGAARLELASFVVEREF